MFMQTETVRKKIERGKEKKNVGVTFKCKYLEEEGVCYVHVLMNK